MQNFGKGIAAIIIGSIIVAGQAYGLSGAFKEFIYNPGQLKDFDSELKVKAGEPAPTQ